MPRHPMRRRVGRMPPCTVFKPAGVPAYDLDEVVLKVEEMEALRLKDLLCLDQEECAELMRVSRATFQRILSEARRKVAEALVEGKVLRIEGGMYFLEEEFHQCPRCQYPHLPPSLKECPKCGVTFKKGGLEE